MNAKVAKTADRLMEIWDSDDGEESEVATGLVFNGSVALAVAFCERLTRAYNPDTAVQEIRKLHSMIDGPRPISGKKS